MFRAAGSRPLSQPLQHRGRRGGCSNVEALARRRVVHTPTAERVARPATGASEGALVVHSYHGRPRNRRPAGRAIRPDPAGVSRARSAWLLPRLPRIGSILVRFGFAVAPWGAMPGSSPSTAFPAGASRSSPRIDLPRSPPNANGQCGGPARARHRREPRVPQGIDVLLTAAPVEDEAPARGLREAPAEPTRAAAADLGLDALFAGHVDDVGAPAQARLFVFRPGPRTFHWRRSRQWPPPCPSLATRVEAFPGRARRRDGAIVEPETVCVGGRD